MNVGDIIREKLVELKADGLCKDGCGCGIDDLFPCCDCDITKCIPAKKEIEKRYTQVEIFVPL